MRKVPDDFWDFTTLEEGTVVYDIPGYSSIWTGFNGFRLLIVRGPVSWCSYIGVPTDSPLAGLGYSDDVMQSFECHGGLTYSGLGNFQFNTELVPTMERYYFGWDYGHGGDWTFSSNFIEARGRDPSFRVRTLNGCNLKKWTFGELKVEIEAAFIQMQQVEIELEEAKRVLELEKWRSKSIIPIRTFQKSKRLIRINGAE